MREWFPINRIVAMIVLVTIGLHVQAQDIAGANLEAQSTDVSVDSPHSTRPGADAAIGNRTGVSLHPFGKNLFSGGFSNNREDGLNPGYVLQSGDRVSVRIWGAIEFNESLTLDPKGNIFIPSVGPVLLSGVANRDVNQRVRDAVNTVYTDQVQVYTSLDGSQPVAVFVTGFVVNPGRYAGIPSNSILHFLDRAGGIESTQGSFRQIDVLRAGESIASVDLYAFLLDGGLPTIQFQDGDTVVVGRLGNVVTVSGDVNNPAVFELTESQLDGADLVAMAQLKPGVSHVGLSGIRVGKPFSTYLSLSQFASKRLANGDRVHFRADQQEDVIVVDVEGEYLGPSRYAVSRDTRLHELLDYIEIDLLLANIDAVSIKRETIAMRQKVALDDSLRRLEARYLTASSQTDQEAVIRAQEAELIGQFVKNARQIQPNGRLVVAREEGIANILLQSGDTITIPSRSDSVLLSGEILVSQAILFQPGLTARDYIERSGGFSTQANEKRIVLVHANGEVTTGNNPAVEAGDEIIVLPEVPVKHLQISATIVDILYKVAIAASVAVSL